LFQNVWPELLFRQNDWGANSHAAVRLAEAGKKVRRISSTTRSLQSLADPIHIGNAVNQGASESTIVANSLGKCWSQAGHILLGVIAK
jgi:hypothetical protein